MAEDTQRPSRFSCPACPRGILLLSAETKSHTIYSCDGEGCGAALWVPTDSGQLIRLTEQLRIARVKLMAKIRRMASRPD